MAKIIYRRIGISVADFLLLALEKYRDDVGQLSRSAVIAQVLFDFLAEEGYVEGKSRKNADPMESGIEVPASEIESMFGIRKKIKKEATHVEGLSPNPGGIETGGHISHDPILEPSEETGK